MTITLITGANKGLGYETARRLLEIGHTVLVGARDPQRGQRAAGELGAVFLQVDPTNDASVAAAADKVRSEYGRLDVLINNAGTAEPRVGAASPPQLAVATYAGPEHHRPFGIIQILFPNGQWFHFLVSRG